MQVIKEGTIFRLLDYGSEEKGQIIAFTEKAPGGTFFPGTTNEEVISMLIERFYTLNRKQPAIDNAIILHQLKGIRQLLAQRVSKKIENQQKREQDNSSARS